MSVYAEIWSRPGAPTFGRVIDDPPTPYHTFHDGINAVGDGSMQIPNTFDRFDEILLIDHTTPANCVSSLVRLFDDSDPTTPIGEWLPSSIIPTGSKTDPNYDIAGEGIKSILRHARTEAFDWDGSVSFVSTSPDWIYGGDTILSDPGYETPTTRSTKIILYNDATSGTFTLSDGTDTTSAIAYDASAFTVETRLETDITAYDDVNVTGSGTASDPWVLEFIDPFQSSTINFQNPTDSFGAGEASYWTTEQFGALQPSGWTKSQVVSSGTPRIFGEYTSFFVSSSQAHSGTYSLFIDPAAIGRRFAGTQQIVNVTPGGLYQASIWVYTASASQEYRLVLRDIDEDYIASTQGTATAGAWTQYTISDLTIPDGVTQLIFRFANINVSGNPAGFYVDDAVLAPGQAANTIGAILGDLYADATSDHSGRIVWEDEANPGTPYLTLDFSDAVDSNGVAWFDSEISIKIWMRMTYLQVMEQFASGWGYEWRIVPDDVEAGTWLWQVYNPGTMKTDYTSSASPAIQGGSQDVRRSIVRVLPNASNSLVEGEQRLTARYSEADLISAIGRIEGSRLDRELPSLTSALSAAYEDSLDALVSGLAYSYELVNPPDVPLVAYVLGDLLTIHDPPNVEDEARLIDVEMVVTPIQTIWEVQFIPATAAGS